MRRSGRPMTRIGLTFFGVLVLGALLVGPQTRVGYAHLGEILYDSTIFQPIGVGAGNDKLQYALLVSHPRCEGDSELPREVRKIDTNGVDTLFATLPSRPACFEGEGFEDYLAISPGLAGFERDSVYVMQGRTIRKIPPTGGTGTNKSGGITVFATIPAPCAASRNGNIFDRYGGFKFQMLVMCANGPIWRVNSNGSSTFVADVATANITTPIEGPDVALPSFLPFARCLLGAAENDKTLIGEDASAGTVFAVCPGGKVSVVAKWPNAESVRFAPPLVWDCVPGNRAKPGAGAYFTALETSGIWKFPASAFSGGESEQKLNGQAFVLNGQGGVSARGIGLFRSVTDSNGVSRIQVSTFHQSFGGGRFHGSAFCGGKRLPKGTVRHSPRRIPNSNGTFTVTIFSTEGLLDVRNIDQSSVHAGFIGFEAPRIRCDLNEQGNALKCIFNIQDGGFPKITTTREKDDDEAQGEEREDERNNKRLKSIIHVMVTGFTKVGTNDPAFCGGD